MGLSTYIRDGDGSGNRGRVNSDGAFKVVSVPINPADLPQEELTRVRFWNGYLVDSAGSNNLTVDGSTTEVEFSVTGQTGLTIYVKSIRMLMKGNRVEIAAGKADSFGNGYPSGLATGCEFFTIQSGDRTDIAVDPIKQLIDFHFYFEENLVAVTGAFTDADEFLSFEIVLEHPIVLAAGSPDKIAVNVRDDLLHATSQIEDFQFLCRGWKI